MEDIDFQLIVNYVGLGRVFGYPKCCITDFIINLYDFTPNKNEFSEKKTWLDYGYIPCNVCCKKPTKLLVEEISKKRLVKTEFPNNSDITHDETLAPLTKQVVMFEVLDIAEEIEKQLLEYKK